MKVSSIIKDGFTTIIIVGKQDKYHVFIEGRELDVENRTLTINILTTSTDGSRIEFDDHDYFPFANLLYGISKNFLRLPK